MIKLQDFARQLGVTDRQVQRLLRKYEDEFEGLIERRGNNGTWLSDEACGLLRSKTRQLPVAPYDGSADEANAKISKLERELEEAKAENKELRTQFLFATQRINNLHQMHEEAEAEAKKQKLLAEKATEETARADREAERADQEAAARADAEKYAADLEAKIVALESDVEAEKERYEAAMNRGFFARLFNKGV